MRERTGLQVGDLPDGCPGQSSGLAGPDHVGRVRSGEEAQRGPGVVHLDRAEPLGRRTRGLQPAHGEAESAGHALRLVAPGPGDVQLDQEPAAPDVVDHPCTVAPDAPVPHP